MKGTYTVSELSMRIFSLVPSGAESEWNFSTKLRNRLSADKVAKLSATNASTFSNYENVYVVDDIESISLHADTY